MRFESDELKRIVKSFTKVGKEINPDKKVQWIKGLSKCNPEFYQLKNYKRIPASEAEI